MLLSVWNTALLGVEECLWMVRMVSPPVVPNSPVRYSTWRQSGILLSLQDFSWRVLGFHWRDVKTESVFKDVFNIFMPLKVVAAPSALSSASIVETAGTAGTYFQARATDQTKILFCSCPQITRGLSFCSLSLPDPLFYSPPILVCFPPLGFLNSAFLSFLLSLFRRIPALYWVLILNKLCKMNSVSLVIQVIRLLWCWGMLKGHLLMIRS